MSHRGQDRREIKITWIKNPSHFAFVFVDCKDDARKHAVRLELDLNRVLSAVGSVPGYTPELDEICRFLHNNTWYRVKVFGKNVASFYCWAMDYGFPFCTDNVAMFAPLGKDLQNDSSVIQFGRLNLVPAKNGFDFDTCEITSVADTQWALKAVTIMKNFSNFATKAEFMVSGSLDGTWYGDIEFTDANSRKFSLGAKLIEQKLALKADNEDEFTKMSLWAGIDQSDCHESIKFELPNILSDSDHESSVSGTAAVLPPTCGTQVLKSNFRSIYSAVQSNSSAVAKTPEKPTSNTSFLEITAKKPLLSNQDVYRIFVHGKYLRDPLEYMKDAMFSAEVHENLRKMNYKTIYKVQSHSWPNILDGRSTIIVNGPSSGKTFSYLPAILSLIFNDGEPTNSPAHGPAGVIIARSSSEVEKIFKYSVRILPRQKMEVIKAYGKWNCKNKTVQLLNGCDLLITTPPCFARLAASEVVRVINKDLLKFLVFDDVDSMSAVFEKELDFVIKTCTSGENCAHKNPQIIVTSSTWMEQLKSRYAKLACDPIFIIGSFIECAVYAKCRFKLFKETLDGKLLRLVEILRSEQWKQKRTLIVTNSMRDFNKLDDCLQTNHIEFRKINHRTLNGFETAEQWAREEVGSMQVLLVTDEALSNEPRNRISSAEVLIHFSLPDDWTKFSRRFAAIKDCCTAFVEENCDEPASTIVMLDDENSKEVPALIGFLKTRRGMEVPEEIGKMVKQIVDLRERQKWDPHFENVAQICSKVLTFGSCENPTSCQKRHVLSEADRPVNLPDGFVKFEITSTRSPAHFFIKILEYWPLGERKWVSCEAKLDKIEAMLVELQENLKESAVMHVPVKIGDTCALYYLPDMKWCRCRVLDKQLSRLLNIPKGGVRNLFFRRQSDNSIFKVIVQLIDSGRKLIVNSNELMKLSPQFVSMEPLICSLRILNIVPYDKDQNWDSETTAEVEKRLKAHGENASFHIAKVSFAIKDVIFTKNIEIQNRHEATEVMVTEYTLKKDLVKSQLCLQDDTVADKLKILLRNANLYVPRCIEATPEKAAGERTDVQAVEPRWKHLAVGCNYNVRLTLFDRPDLFYVLLADSTNLTVRPHMKTIEKFDDLKLLAEVSEGTLCLVAEQGQKRQRAVIIKTLDQNFVKVFLLDAGKSIECEPISLYELPPELMEIAPFQAVQCRLMGVKPKFGIKTWEKASRLSWAFADFIHERCDGNVVKMQTVARDGHVFDVVLFDPANGQRLDVLAVEELLAHTDENFSYKPLEEVEESERAEDEKAATVDEQAAPTESLEKLLDLIKSEHSYTTLLDGIGSGLDAAKYLNEENKENLPRNKRAVARKPIPKKQEAPTGLSFIYQQPKIEFRQNDEVVILDIKATDAVDYALKISDESMKVQVMFDDRSQRTEVFFYRLVDSAYASHEMAGSRIIVRLVKKVFGLHWPRLSESDEPNNFITNLVDEPLRPDYLVGSNCAKEHAGCAHSSYSSGGSLDSYLSEDDERQELHVPL